LLLIWFIFTSLFFCLGKDTEKSDKIDYYLPFFLFCVVFLIENKQTSVIIETFKDRDSFLLINLIPFY
jgi:ABC-type uncharacterized transport system permease subunit